MFIEFQMNFGLIFDVFLIPLPFAHATFLTIKHFVLQMNFKDLTLQRNMFFKIFLIFSVTSFSIYFFPAKGRQHGSNKRPKWDQKSSRRRIFEIFGRSGRRCFFNVFWDRKKSAQNPEKSLKMVQKTILTPRPAECAGLPER